MRVLCLLTFAALLALVSASACDSSFKSKNCDQLTSDATVAIALDQAQAATDLSCASASDCVVVATSSACLPNCSVVLTSAGAAKLQAAIAQINVDSCATFASDGCPANPAPSCLSYVPSCVNGQCTALIPSEDAGEDASTVVSTDDAGTDAEADASDAACPCIPIDASADSAADSGFADAANDATGE
jgi:hypothetical protein